jgi:tetratricopeptide (TPR) repeat protein
MAYAHLQLGQDGEAKRIVGELAAIEKFSGGRTYGRDTGEAAPAARYVLERAAWSEAAALPVRENAFTYAQAIPRFTRAVAAARLGDAATVKGEAAELKKLAAKAENSYWAEQIEVLALAASAWMSRAERQDEQALKLMRGAADLEDSTEKHVSMENRLYPMREMLGDLLLELGRPGEALAEYEKSNHATPNRLRGLYGAAKAAAAAGDTAKARQYFIQLTELGAAAEPERAEIVEAKTWLQNQKKG